jgi:hypothetical protein
MRLSKLCCSLANVLILSEVALAADSHHWPFQIAGKLPDRDINAIVSVISHTKGIDHRICWIEVKTPSEVWVFTGKSPESNRAAGTWLPFANTVNDGVFSMMGHNLRGFYNAV